MSEVMEIFLVGAITGIGLCVLVLVVLMIGNRNGLDK